VLPFPLYRTLRLEEKGMTFYLNTDKAPDRERRRRPQLVIGVTWTALLLVLVACGGGEQPTPTPDSVLANSVEVPINAIGASNVGSLEFVVVYDPEVLIPTKVEKGLLATNALIESNTLVPSQVWVGMVDANGMSGDGSLIAITFEVLGGGSLRSLLTIENTTAYDADTLLDILSQAAAGAVLAQDRSFTAPVIRFSQ